MPSTFACHAWQYKAPLSKTVFVETPPIVQRTALFFFVLLACWLASLCFAIKPAFANSREILNTIPPMTVFYGKPFVYQYEPIAIDPEHLRVRLLNKPSGATLVTNAQGMPEFRWTPPINVLPSTVVIVQAYDIRDQNNISTQRMVLQKGPYALRNAEPIVSADATKTEHARQKLDTVDSLVVDSLAVNNSTVSSSAVSIAKEGQASTAMQVDAEPTVDEAAVAASTSGVAREFSENTASGLTKPSPVIASQAPQLPVIDTQALTVGVEFQLFIRPVDVNGDVVSLSVKGLPVGAELRTAFGGSWVLRWRPEASQAGEHRLMLIAVENTPALLQTERMLTLDVHDPNAQTRLVLASAKVSADTSGTDSTDDTGEAVMASSAKPGKLNFEPLSSQIVSAGHTINLPIVSRVGSEGKTIVHVDRLPSGATFDLNDDGTRTFYWPTTQADQGEHIFRFTAINPRDASQVINKELLIVVGDPAAPGSMPQ